MQKPIAHVIDVDALESSHRLIDGSIAALGVLGGILSL